MHKAWWGASSGYQTDCRLRDSLRGTLLPRSGTTTGEVVAHGSQSLCTPPQG